MITQFKLKALLVAAVMAVPSASIAQQGHGHEDKAPATAFVHFGIFPPGPLGPAPCGQGTETPPIVPGGPARPLRLQAPRPHTRRSLGQQGRRGHIPIPRWRSRDRDLSGGQRAPTRDEVGQFLCAGDDPADFHAPTDTHPCPTVGAANANAVHEVKDGDGDIVIVATANVTNVHPENRVSYEPGRLMSAGEVQFMNGGTVATGTGPTGGQLTTYRFLKPGRYLVICMNRSHFLNDWMFGFVNVKGNDDN